MIWTVNEHLQRATSTLTITKTNTRNETIHKGGNSYNNFPLQVGHRFIKHIKTYIDENVNKH